jgi:class 3 adenylate cyclase
VNPLKDFLRSRKSLRLSSDVAGLAAILALLVVQDIRPAAALWSAAPLAGFLLLAELAWLGLSRSGSRQIEDLRRMVLRSPVAEVGRCGAVWLTACMAFWLVSALAMGQVRSSVLIAWPQLASWLGLGLPCAAAVRWVGSMAIAHRLLPALPESGEEAWRTSPLLSGMIWPVALAPLASLAVQIFSGVPASAAVLCFYLALSCFFVLALLSSLHRFLLQPLQSVNVALGRLETGDFEAHAEPGLTLEAGRLAGHVNRLGQEMRKLEALRGTFSSLVPRPHAERLLEGGTRLDGETRPVTLLAVHLRDFYERSAGLDGKSLTAMLNRYYQVVCGEIEKEGGLLEQFDGPLVLAAFNGLSASENPAQQAATAAKNLARSLTVLNTQWHLQGRPSFTSSLALATGKAVVAHLGPTGRRTLRLTGGLVEGARTLALGDRGSGQEKASIQVDAATLGELKEPHEVREGRLLP